MAALCLQNEKKLAWKVKIFLGLYDKKVKCY